MKNEQIIILISALCIAIGFFSPLFSLQAVFPLMGGTANHNWTHNISIFSTLGTTKNLFPMTDKYQFFMLVFFIYSILSPVIYVIICFSKKYTWLFPFAFSYILCCFSFVFLINNKANGNDFFHASLGWGWGFLLIPSFVVLIIGIKYLISKDSSI